MRRLALLALLFLCCASHSQTPVYLLRLAGDWRAEHELECARRTLAGLGAPPRLVESARGLPPGLLVLSNARCMSAEEVAAVRDFCRRGGKLLATAQTSYRQADGSPWQPNGMALSPELGGDFSRWIQPDRLDGILLGKRNAMVLLPRPGTEVLARFERGEPAILATECGIYVGEDLLAPENTAALEVRELLGKLLARLLPGFVARAEPYRELPPSIPYREMLPEGPELRVLVEEKVPALSVGRREVRAILTVGKPPALAVYDAAGKLVRRSTEPVRLGEEPYAVLRITRSNGAYRWGAYRGELDIAPGPHGLRVVNVLSLEEYCAGVVPNEVPPSFPPEALKAMAVVARTYALTHRGEKHAGADLCDEVHCQVYGGLASEADSTTAAVLATEGIALSGVETTFHAVCGGVGQDAERVWAGRGGLRGRPDTLESDPGDLSSESAVTAFLEQPPKDACCSRAGRFRWQESYSAAELEARLAKSLPGWRGPLRELQVTERGPLGRIEELAVVGAETRMVRGDAIRWLTSGGKIGAAGLNSTLFVVRRRGDRFELRGGGWGHGVGMCQEGAAGRARAGHDFRAILRHYYPGAPIS